MNRWKSASVKKVRKEGFDADDLDKLELVAAADSVVISHVKISYDGSITCEAGTWRRPPQGQSLY